ncbi:MAG: hypothetical protein ACYTBP_01610 [Planctomycetota bacterium]|jgi:hypothetical protein
MVFEDLSTYMLNDVGEFFDVNPDTKVTWTDLPRNQDAFLYSDKGVNHFAGDFTHQIETQFSSWGVGAYGMCHAWMLANATTGPKAIIDAAGDMLAFRHIRETSSYDFIIGIWESGVNVDYDRWSGVSAGVVYYVTIVRNETAGTLTAYIRTGSHSGPLQDTLVASIGVDNNFRYIYPAVSFNSDNTVEASGFCRNINLGVSISKVMHHYKQMQGVS